VMPVGGDAAVQKRVIAALNRYSKPLKGLVARQLNAKYAAILHFRLDESFAVGSKIDALLRDPKVARDLENPPPSIVAASLPGDAPADRPDGV
jgi:ribosome-binding factor A